MWAPKRDDVTWNWNLESTGRLVLASQLKDVTQCKRAGARTLENRRNSIRRPVVGLGRSSQQPAAPAARLRTHVIPARPSAAGGKGRRMPRAPRLPSRRLALAQAATISLAAASHPGHPAARAVSPCAYIDVHPSIHLSLSLCSLRAALISARSWCHRFIAVKTSCCTATLPRLSLFLSRARAPAGRQQ